jgi:hypothetical protein
VSIIIDDPNARYGTYLTMIRNSVGSMQYRSLYAIVDGSLVDIAMGGRRACAYFVSAVLHICRLIDSYHARVTGTEKDLLRNNWNHIERVGNICVPGDVIIWDRQFGTEHIGFYIGNGDAVSTCPNRLCVILHDITFQGTRDIRAIYTHGLLQQ